MKRYVVLGVLALLLVGVAWADTTSTTVTFVIPSSVAHSLTYGGSCSSSLFYFVETDSTKDGTLDKINVTSDTAGSNECQNTTIGAFTINNDGSAGINVTMNISTALPSGVEIKSAYNDTGWESTCSGTADNTTCVDIINGAGATLVDNLAGQTGTQEIWTWADFSNFNSGLATTGIARTMQTTAVEE